MNTITINGKEFDILEFDDIKRKCYGFIYVTVNKINGMKYVGLHYKWDRNYLGSGHYLQSAIKKYGKETFDRYIIDTADSYEELCSLEAKYITELFGEDCAKSSNWYNITSGLQRGGNTWLGMTEEAREERRRKISEANKGRKMTEEQREANRRRVKERFKDSAVRRKISEATRKAMADPELRKRLSEIKKGKKQNLSPERRKQLSEIGKRNCVHLIGIPPWNKGKTLSDEHKEKLRKAKLKHYKVTVGDELIFDDFSVEGCLSAISNRFSCNMSEALFYKILKSNKPYRGRKEKLHGLRIEVVGDKDGKQKASKKLEN